MSATESHQEPQVSPEASDDDSGSPYNTQGDWHYWPRDEDGNPVPPEEHQRPSGHAELEGTDQWKRIAQEMLAENAPLFCPISLEEFDEEIELDDATAYPPREDGKIDVEYQYRFEPRTYRVNEKYGFLPGGPIIGNRPIEEFQLDVWSVLEGAVLAWENTRSKETGIDYDTAEEIWDRSMEMKRDGGPHDQTIMAKVAAWIDEPQLLEFEQ